MPQPVSTDLLRKYGFGLVLVVLAAIGSTILGDALPLVVLKTMVAVPFAFAWISLPALFDAEGSRTPFTPSFIERTALEAVLLSLAIAIFAWSPEHDALRLVSISVFVAVVYFGAQSILRNFRRG